MPAIILQREETNATTLAAPPSNGQASESVKPWIIGVIVAGLVVLVGLGVFFIWRYMRRRNLQQPKINDRCVTPRDFIRRRKMSEADMMEEAEMQRRIMIRKSLASRSSLLNRNSQSVASEFSMDDDEDEAAGGLKDDWKVFEARVVHERSISGHVHPAVTEDYEEPAIPEPVRPKSQVLGTQLTPAFRSTSTFGPTLSLHDVFGTAQTKAGFERFNHSGLKVVGNDDPDIAKTHSPLCRILLTAILTEKGEPVGDRIRGAVEKKSDKNLERQKRKEQRRKRQRRVLEELHNLQAVKSPSPLMIPEMAMDPNGAAEYNDRESNILICFECKEDPPNLIEEFSAGDTVCGTCGIVLGGRIIDSRSEWRTFANDDQNGDDPSRVGEVANSLQDDEGLRTQVDTKATNGKLAGKLNSIQKKSHANDKLNTDLQEGFRGINKYIDLMHQGQAVAQAAMHIYKLAYEHGQLKGKAREAMIAGCIFIACRQCGAPRTFRDIHAITHIPKKEIGRVFKSLESFLTKIQERNPQASAAQGVKDYRASTSTSAEDLCTRYCSALGFRNTPRVEKISKALARKTTKVSDLAGRSPLSVAAACIYFASHYLEDPKPSKDIASVAGVSDGTIKTAYRFLYQVREMIVEGEDWNGNLDKLPVN